MFPEPFPQFSFLFEELCESKEEFAPAESNEADGLRDAVMRSRVARDDIEFYYWLYRFSFTKQLLWTMFCKQKNLKDKKIA